MDQLIDSIHFLSLLVYFIAFILMTQFYIKLRHEKYWVGFPVTLLFFTLHEFFEILNDNYNVQIVIGNINMHTEVLAEISEIIGAIVLVLSLYYLIKELRKINFLESVDSDEKE